MTKPWKEVKDLRGTYFDVAWELESDGYQVISDPNHHERAFIADGQNADGSPHLVGQLIGDNEAEIKPLEHPIEEGKMFDKKYFQEHPDPDHDPPITDELIDEIHLEPEPVKKPDPAEN